MEEETDLEEVCFHQPGAGPDDLHRRVDRSVARRPGVIRDTLEVEVDAAVRPPKTSSRRSMSTPTRMRTARTTRAERRL